MSSRVGCSKYRKFCTIFDQITLRLRHSNKRRCANIRRRSEAKHCSSLCSQSEGGRILWRPNMAKNPTKSCPKALVIFATCSWPSLCKQSELQCWRRNRRLCGPAQISAARALLPMFNILSTCQDYLEHPKVMLCPCNLTTF